MAHTGAYESPEALRWPDVPGSLPTPQLWWEWEQGHCQPLGSSREWILSRMPEGLLREASGRGMAGEVLAPPLSWCGADRAINDQ